MARNTKYVLFGIVHLLVISGLTFQYMYSRKCLLRIHATDHLRTFLRSNTTEMLRTSSGLSSEQSNRNISLPSPNTRLLPSRPPPTPGTVAIDWSGINMTSVNNMRHKIKKYFEGKLTMIVYKRTASVDDMVFNTNVTQLEKTNVTEYLPHQDTCAIIGNSGILLNSSCGREINAHDFVVRANSAPTLGYERDVGYRTSVMMLNHASTLTLKRSLGKKPIPKKENRTQTYQNFNDTIVWYGLAAGGPATGVLKSTASKLGNHNFRVAYSINSPMNISKRLWRLPLPTTGLNMFSAMNYYCDKISLYGFFPFYVDKQGRRLQYRYYDIEVKYNFTDSYHKMPYEFVILTELRDSGVLRLVTDRCNSGGRR